ncbi:DUF5719 family protein [Streptomyces alkaliterrae]|uniref:Secreted protein n=1 Tax=Streptomyces alkaliterrae TaxID=2213162 RepID=A0A5P0YXB0_9ACTN|nr:DUF5719 family protein [Streptomyces alkaliterrae]MBB1255021.1 hypothetical protein [Streptomyces alkaliterrae]MBB1261329.1 hypothetical protein [Streptomyces alkaliterrae]MQS04925.1 hypothetical protein [Streptomyces alkaliterrae]
MNRTAVSLLAVGTALAALTGVAALNAPGSEPASAERTSRLPVQRSTLVCPQPAGSDLAETVYTAYSAPHPDVRPGDKRSDTAGLLPAGHTLEGGGQGSDDKDGRPAKKPDPVLPLKKPGTPVTHTTDQADAPALTGSAEGALAPGWTVQQSTTISAGPGRGLLGLSCTVPDTEFWFSGVSTAKGRHDYIHLTNPDDAPATVDLQLYGKDGELRSESGTGLNIPPGATVPVLLATLTPEPVTNVSLHVAVRIGRVGAQVQALDEKLGSDWITPSHESADRLVLPGIPADATAVRLVAFATGDRDVELDVRFAGANSSISPAGNETLHVKSGMTAAVDLPDLTRGEAGSLVLTPSKDSPRGSFVAALRILRGKEGKQETAFIPAVAPVGERTTASGHQAKGGVLYLTAPGEAAKVKVTASAGSDGGRPASRELELKPGTTTAVDDLRPDGVKGTFAYTVERLSGGHVHVARMLETKESGSSGVPMFSIQALPDDRSTVAVPGARQDLTVLDAG